MVVSGEQITMRSTWVSNRGESPPQTKVTLKQLFDPPSRGGVQPVRPASGRRLGPQVAVSEGGGRQRVEAEGGGRRKEEEEHRNEEADTEIIKDDNDNQRNHEHDITKPIISTKRKTNQ